MMAGCGPKNNGARPWSGLKARPWSDLEARKAQARTWFEIPARRIMAAFETLEDEAPANLYRARPGRLKKPPGAAARMKGGGGDGDDAGGLFEKKWACISRFALFRGVRQTSEGAGP